MWNECKTEKGGEGALRILRGAFRIMLTAKYSKEAIYFKGDALEEELLASEALHANRIESYVHNYTTYENGRENKKRKIVSELNWHLLITRGTSIFSEHPINNTLNRWGLNVLNMTGVEPLLESKRKKNRRDSLSLDEFKETAHYKTHHSRLLDLYGEQLSNGDTMFKYQLEGAALIAARKRVILAFDMGLGKTRTTLIGLTTNLSNKKILIVTLSRNLEDWIKEIKILGLQSDYVELRNPGDMKSDKRIHLVSYERWARDSVLLIKNCILNVLPANIHFLGMLQGSIADLAK